MQPLPQQRTEIKTTDAVHQRQLLRRLAFWARIPWLRFDAILSKVRKLLGSNPIKIKLDVSRSQRYVVRNILAQAEERQKNTPGMYHAGAVLQHLVGAKLDCALGKGRFEHNSFSTADSPGARVGDFFLGDVAIHVTTSPGEAVIERCRDNLDGG